MNKIGVLLVTYNQIEVTTKFVKNFYDKFNCDNQIHFLVLDNCSSDNTASRLNEIFPKLNCIELNDNYGCVIGRNLGIIELANLGCDYIAIFDNDVEIEDPRYFEKMLSFMASNTHIHACCPVVRWGDDRTIQTMGFGVSVHNYLKMEMVHDPIALPGCAQFIRTDSFAKFGLYDNDLSPISIEDYEWGIRNKCVGLKMKCNTDVEVLHHHDRHRKDNENKVSMVIRGRIVFLRKHFNLKNLCRELILLFKLIPQYPVSLLFSSYRSGFRKEINMLPFDFYNFSKIDKSEFFRNRVRNI